MKKIIFINRNQVAGFSIYKVSKPIIDRIENKENLFLPKHGGSLIVLLQNLYFILKNRQRGAIHHITGDVHYGILALLGYKSVLNVHDTVSLDFNQSSKLKKRLIEYIWYRLPLRLATKVTCISEQTKLSLEKLTKRKDIQVIHDPIDTTLRPKELAPISEYPKILFIGTKENKNLIRCFEALKDIKCQITIVGKLKGNQIDKLHELDLKYHNKWNLSDEELNEEYYNCDIVSFCSLYEGFGMPALEANQVGRPVLCSDIPVLKEVAGEAACYANPYDVSSICEAYHKLIENDSYRRQLVDNGRKNVKRFLPDNIIEEWIDLYSKL